MTDHERQSAQMTQKQRTQGEWTTPRPSPEQNPREEPRHPESRREGNAQHETPQVENQDPRQNGGLNQDVGAPFNPLVITWQFTQGR